MEILRTPDARFTGLEDWPYPPHYATLADADGTQLRLHYVDEGPRDAPVALLMHGEPSWAYLYRKIIAELVAAGYRAIAPDLIGFGRSDKPAERGDYTYARHVEWMREFLFDRLDLTDVTLVCQDWGGLIGLRLVGEHPERFARVVAANTSLPTGDVSPGEAFFNWQNFSQGVEVFPTGFIINSGCVTKLAPEVQAAYDAPFPDESFKAGARAFPMLVPSSPDDPAHDANVAAWRGLAAFPRPFLTAFGDGDPITRGAHRALQEGIAGAQGQPHTTIVGGGHFLQEDCGEELAQVVADFVSRTS
jgi:haloalkane dehalogenase